jgi:hypothetical protein
MKIRLKTLMETGEAGGCVSRWLRERELISSIRAIPKDV